MFYDAESFNQPLNVWGCDDWEGNVRDISLRKIR